MTSRAIVCFLLLKVIQIQMLLSEMSFFEICVCVYVCVCAKINIDVLHSMLHYLIEKF